jgi:hypothetical protein
MEDGDLRLPRAVASFGLRRQPAAVGGGHRPLGCGWPWPDVVWLAWPGPVVAGQCRLWLAMASWRFLFLRQHYQSGAALVVGLEGLVGACCGIEVVLRVAPGLFRWWCCGGDGEWATTMTMSAAGVVLFSGESLHRLPVGMMAAPLDRRSSRWCIIVRHRALVVWGS